MAPCWPHELCYPGLDKTSQTDDEWQLDCLIYPISKWVILHSVKEYNLSPFNSWGPSGAERTQVGPMLDPWTLLSGFRSNFSYWWRITIRLSDLSNKQTSRQCYHDVIENPFFHEVKPTGVSKLGFPRFGVSVTWSLADLFPCLLQERNIKLQKHSAQKIHLKMSPKWLPFYAMS